MLKIAIVGAESTGKSDLAQKLASHFQTVWVKEYAREYLAEKQQKYEYADILKIAQGQHLKAQETIEKYHDKAYLFFDTELLVTKIWAEYVFGKCHEWILKELPKQTYDFYLLTNIDLPWEYDPLREHPEPEKRFELHHLYQKNLTELGFAFAEISGLGNRRFINALQAIEGFQKC